MGNWIEQFFDRNLSATAGDFKHKFRVLDHKLNDHKKSRQLYPFGADCNGIPLYNVELDPNLELETMQLTQQTLLDRFKNDLDRIQWLKRLVSR